MKKILILTSLCFLSSFEILANDLEEYLNARSRYSYNIVELENTKVIFLKSYNTSGTGFFITPDIIVTAYHIIRGFSDIGFFWDQARNKNIFLKVLAIDEKYDLALLQLKTGKYLDKELDLKNTKPLSERIKKKEPVTVIGFPNRSYTEIQGNLISDKELLRITFKNKREFFRVLFFHFILDKLIYIKSEKYLHTIKMGSYKNIVGASGSPVFSKEGELLGVLVKQSRIIDTIYYVPIEKLRDLIRETLGSNFLSESEQTTCQKTFH